MVSVAGGGGCCWFLAHGTKTGGGGVLLVSVWPCTKTGGGGGGYDPVSGGLGYCTVVEVMCTGINRQRKRAAIVIKCSYYCKM